MKSDRNSQAHDFVQRAPRVDIIFDVLVRCAAGEFEARVTNLSARGFRLRSPQALDPGSEISLEFGKLPPVCAVIRWAAGNDVGGSFTHAVTI